MAKVLVLVALQKFSDYGLSGRQRGLTRGRRPYWVPLMVIKGSSLTVNGSPPPVRGGGCLRTAKSVCGLPESSSKLKSLVRQEDTGKRNGVPKPGYNR